LGAGPSAFSEIAAEVFGAEIETARRIGNLGYMARVLAQVTLPHSRPDGNEYIRHNGNFSLKVLAPSQPGLPYGGIPRVVLAWLTTEAVRKRERTVVLGNSLSKFMSELGLVPTGGRWGSIPRVQNQLKRLFSSRILCTYDGQDAFRTAALDVASSSQLWWDPKDPHQLGLFQSTVTLGESFFEEIIERPIPVDVATLRLLRRSPLALDLYVWMTYRNSYLDRPVEIPWEGLHAQFGADYRLIRQFKPHVTAALAKVHRAYPEARFETSSKGLRLIPSPTHIRRFSKAKVMLTSVVDKSPSDL
jgi:hypothetical protein